MQTGHLKMGNQSSCSRLEAGGEPKKRVSSGGAKKKNSSKSILRQELSTF